MRFHRTRIFTYGPFERKDCRIVAKYIVKHADKVYSRDERSRKYLGKIGVEKDIQTVTDVAFRLPYNRLTNIVDTNKIKIGINISGLLWEDKQSGINRLGLTTDYVEYSCRVVNELLETSDYEIYLISHAGMNLGEKASSGGILTEIAIHLLKSGCVDGVIQTRVSCNSPIKTETVVSTKEEDVRSCAGSRYTVSSPLFELTQLIEEGKKYAFIGKPCDVQVVHNWQGNDSKKREQIPYLVSFFCAGVPSLQAERKLLESLNTNEKECTKITYRGNGWPGYTVAYSAQGQTGQMSYEESWGKILGRDVALACRFCLR